MYIPKFNNVDDFQILSQHIQQYPFGTWSALCDGEVVVNHIPFLFKPEVGDYGMLVGHVSKANPIWKSLQTGKHSVVSFHGEQSYISPSWYPSKELEGKAVPTWNYIIVHAHGIPKVIEDSEWLLNHVGELTNQQESKMETPWSVSDAPEEYINQLIQAIVGIEIPVVKIEGKWKLGQNKSKPDQQGMVSGLEKQGDSSASLACAINQLG